MNDLAELARKVGVNERTLRRAFNEGTIRGTRPSPRRLKLPIVEKEYLLDHWPLLSRLRQVLRTEPSVTFALLFGSVARGDDTEGSDVDLLVTARDPETFDRFRLAVKVEEALGREVDVITIEDAAGNPLLLAEAAQEGRVIVDREGLWPRFSGEGKRFERQAKAQYRTRKKRVFEEPPSQATIKDAQRARAAIEHDYVGLAAGDVHRAVKTVAKAAPEFIGRYKPWIAPYL